MDNFRLDELPIGSTVYRWSGKAKCVVAYRRVDSNNFHPLESALMVNRLRLNGNDLDDLSSCREEALVFYYRKAMLNAKKSEEKFRKRHASSLCVLNRATAEYQRVVAEHPEYAI